MTKVFISRKLEPNSAFKQKLSTLPLEIEDYSLVEFKSQPFELPKEYDWLFFYSRTGVIYFFRQIHKFLSSTKIAALGPGTAEAIEKIFGIVPDFVGNGIPDETAKQFSEKASGQKVVFIRAEESRKSVQKILQNQVIASDVIAYKNSAKGLVDKIEADILVFTSPLNAKAYFSKYTLESFQKVIAIGQTTAEALNALGIDKPVISEQPAEESLAELVKALTEIKNK
jgi:uroporphyrinogen-III synthase